MASDITKCKLMAFDIYGILIDWETGLSRVSNPSSDNGLHSPSITQSLLMTIVDKFSASMPDSKQQFKSRTRI